MFGDGYARIRALADELTVLRATSTTRCPDLVAEVRRMLGVDVEVPPARRRLAGEQLDAFADIVDAGAPAGGAQR